MIKFYPDEEWKEFQLEHKPKFRYAISNYGRLLSFTEKMEEGRLLKPGTIDGYKVFGYKIRKDGKLHERKLFIRRLVAENFIPKENPEQIYVLLLDRDRSNNKVENLKWATHEEMILHSKNSPYVIESKKQVVEKRKKMDGYKLSQVQVKMLKRILFDPNRKTRVRILAKQFGVSELTLYRIKRGENWGHVTED